MALAKPFLFLGPSFPTIKLRRLDRKISSFQPEKTLETGKDDNRGQEWGRLTSVFKLSSKMVVFLLKYEPEQEASVKHLSAQLSPVISPMLTRPSDQQSYAS